MTVRSFARIGFVMAAAAIFFLWHAPLLTSGALVRGFNSDAAIIGLMGKKMFEGRGFDVFFWGQNYVGPLTSMFIAAAGAFTGGVTPLALRLGAFVETFGGILLMGWGLARIDRRAAVITVAALLITPPVLLRMMVTPLGAEMSFFCAAALFAVLAQHLTAEPGAGWLSRAPGQLGFGMLAGLSWWMNQQVVFTLMAAALVLAVRSRLGKAVLREIRLSDRLLLRGNALGWPRMPGVLEAFVWFTTRLGFLLLAIFIVLDLAGRPGIPFVFGRVTDALILIVVPQLVLPLALGEWRRWQLRRPTGEETGELLAIVRFAIGFAIAYAPVWLGAMLGWYERSYVFGFRFNYPSQIVAALPAFVREVAPHWTGIADGLLGILFAIVLTALVFAGAFRARTPARALLALIPLANFVFFLLAHGAKMHYFISSAGMLFGLAALGAVELWDRHRGAVRTAIAVAGVISVASIGVSAAELQRDVREEPDPLILLRRVRANQCAVCYTDFWIAYRYRFLDGERSAWIPYLSQNRTRAESFAAQKRPGQRCLIAKDGTVTRIQGDLPIVHVPPRRRVK